MATLGSAVFLLNVETIQLTRALKHLCKVEKRAKEVRLEYGSRILTISLGKSTDEVAADGTWPPAVFVKRIWATTFADRPIQGAITVLRPANGWLDTSGNKMECWLEPVAADVEAAAGRDEDVAAAHLILARCGVTKNEIHDLIETADAEVAQLWGAGDGSLVDEVAREWLRLAVHGLETSDIRRMIDRKAKGLWASGRKEGALFECYSISEGDIKALIESGHSAKAQLFSRNLRLLSSIAQAWKRLVLYGVEPSEILRLLESKSNSRASAKTRGDSQ